jgi:hypothetical protein
MPSKTRILIVCTGNTCRSPMAEGLARSTIGNRADVETPEWKPSTDYQHCLSAMFVSGSRDYCDLADSSVRSETLKATAGPRGESSPGPIPTVIRVSAP